MAAVDRSLVANLAMFAGLDPAEQDELLREARSVRYPKGTSVFDQGAEADRFFVLLHGHLRVEKTTPQGQQTVVRYVSAGELFGVAQAMNLKRYSATAVAAVDSIALSWPSSNWHRMIVKFPSLAVNALQCRQPPAGHAGSRDRDIQRTGRAASRPRVAAAGEAGRAQGKCGSRDRLSD